MGGISLSASNDGERGDGDNGDDNVDNDTGDDCSGGTLSAPHWASVTTAKVCGWVDDVDMLSGAATEADAVETVVDGHTDDDETVLLVIDGDLLGDSLLLEDTVPTDPSGGSTTIQSSSHPLTTGGGSTTLQSSLSLSSS